MRIDTNKTWTAASLRDHLLGADDNLVIDFFKTPKKQMTGECWCGCGASTKSKFAPGHDSKFHSLAKQVARGLEEMPEDFVNEDAEADFMKWHDAEVPKHEARVMAKAIKAAEKTKKEPKIEEAKEAKPEPKIEPKPEAPVVAGERFAQPEPVTDDLEALLAEVTMS